MALTPEETLQRRLTDPYFSLAEGLSAPTLAESKKMSLAAATVEKNREQNPAEQAANEQREIDESVGLLDIAEASLRESFAHTTDFFTGAPLRDNETVLREADIASGVTPEARKRLVTDPQQKVADSLAAGDYLGAIPQALAAGPGTLASSAGPFAELAIGALATRGVAGKQTIKKQLKDAGTKLDGMMGKTIAAAPRAAGQVSLVSADLTQRQSNEFEQLHGRAPTIREGAEMYALNMATTMLDPFIIKNLFIPSFKKQIGKEIQTLGKNLGSGSNFKQIAKRVYDGTKKVTAAAGAEAGQEYFQTWAEHLNVGLGPEQRKEYFQSVLAILGDKDKQLESLVGAYLGGGAGATARAAITVPAVAAGATLDTAKGTVKTAAKVTSAAVKQVGKGVAAVSNAAAYKVLSEEEREVIRSEHESRKTIVDAKVGQFEEAVNQVKGAATIAELRGNENISEVVSRRILDLGLTDTALEDRKGLEKLKAAVIRDYRGDIALLKTELAGTAAAAVATRAGQNVKSKSVDAAKAAVDAISPGVEAVVEGVKQYGDQAVKAVKELRSSTALGIIEMAATAGKKETATLVEAAKSLSLDDLQRTTAVVSDIKPELARQLQRVITSKEKALERTGIKRKTVVNETTLNPIIKDVVSTGTVTNENVAAVSSAINESVAGQIEDIQALQDVEFALAKVEDTAAFETQTQGAMSRDNVIVLKRKLAKIRTRLEREPTVVEKATKVAKDATKTVVDAAKPVGKKVVEKVAAKAAPKIKVSETFRTVVEGVTKSIQDPKQADILMQAVPDLVKQMKRFGVETRSDFLAFVEEFPGIAENVEFYSAVEAEFPTNVSTKEVMDNLSTMALDTTQKIKDAYNDMNPPECKI